VARINDQYLTTVKLIYLKTAQKKTLTDLATGRVHILHSGEAERAATGIKI
jgi:hypothetical protein